MLLVGEASVTRADILPLYGMHVALALLTGALSLAVRTAPAHSGCAQ